LRDKRQADRVKAVIALSKGWSAALVAEILLFDEKTSRLYFERYQQGVLKALLDDHYSGAKPKLDTHQHATLVRYIKEPKNLEEYKFLYEGKEKTPSGWTVRHDVFITIGEWPHVKRGEKGKRKLESLGHADRLRHEGVRFGGWTEKQKNSHEKAKYAQKTTK